MELAIREAKARLSELVAAARNGERVIITKHGHPAADLVRCERRGGIDFDKLEAALRRLGIEGGCSIPSAGSWLRARWRFTQARFRSGKCGSSTMPVIRRARARADSPRRT